MSTKIPLKGAPKETTKVQRVDVKIPAPFKEGYPLRANEADALNAQYHNSVRNAVAPSVKALLEQAGALAEDGSLIPEKVDVKAVQEVVDNFIADYDFGQGGGGRVDPVQHEAMEMARGLIRNAIAKKGGKVSDYSAKAITEKARELLAHETHGPAIRKKAEETVKNRESLADIDI